MARRLITSIAIVLAIGSGAIGTPKGVPYVQSRLPAYVGHGFSRAVFAQTQEEPGAPRARMPVTFLQINDVYSTVPVDGFGGLARVATLKKQLAAAGRTPFLIIAGDFLSPSVASSVFKGEQMITALNAMGLDLATLGNHEFDFGDDVLIRRMKEAKFQWVVTNVIDTKTNRPIGGAPPYVVKTFGTLKVGFLGLCLNSGEIAGAKLTHTRLLDPVASAGKYIPILRREGAQVIVAVTHVDFAVDRTLIETYPQIDLIIGGHEHFPITTTENRTLISKAGSDAKYVARIDVGRRANRTVERFYELLPITSAIPDDAGAAEAIASYESRLSAELDVVVGRTAVPLDAVSLRLRANEGNIGNLVADAIRADAKTDVALMNSGSIRGDRIYPAGPLSRRDLLAIHPFGNVTCTIAVTGRLLVAALEHGVSALPATNGQFPQVSGLTMAIDPSAPVGSRVKDVKIGGQPLDAAKTYTLALPDFVLKGGDGYAMFKDSKVLVSPEAGPLLVEELEKYVAEKREVAPQVEGRIAIKK